MSDPVHFKTSLNRGERMIGFSSLTLLAVLLALFHFIHIGGAVIASGQAVAQGNPREVQSLEGGIVREIRVRNGDTVSTGEVLVRLDATFLQINRDILRNRLAGLAARQNRLETEEQGLADLVLPQAAPYLDGRLLLRHHAGQREIFLSRRAVLENRKAQLSERILQYGTQIAGLQAQIEAVQSQIGYVTQEVTNLQKLHEQGLVPESRLLEFRGRQAALLGEIATLQFDRAGIQNAIHDSELKILEAERAFREEVVTELQDVIAQFEENRLELARVEEGLDRLEIRAPVNGVIHEMQIATEGGVVPPKETILTLVPVADGVEFDLRVASDAIDTVYVGQPARVRFPAFNQRTTPELSGLISGISPDSVPDRTTGRSFYRVEVTVSREELARLGEAELIPGMPVEAFLQTQQRSILSFLVKPFTDQLSHAFREG